jgi:hypothetical protein
MKIDPPENGKGGGTLDGRIWREFPTSKGKLESETSTRHEKNGSIGRALFAG